MRLFTLSLALEPASATALRSQVRSALAESGVPAETIEQIVLAAGEALSNAILHSRQTRGHVRVTLSVFESRVYLTISDRGRGFDEEQVRVDADNGQGLGLTLLHGLMDEVLLDSTEQGTSIRLVKRIPQA